MWIRRKGGEKGEGCARMEAADKTRGLMITSFAGFLRVDLLLFCCWTRPAVNCEEERREGDGKGGKKIEWRSEEDV